jgi:hypothetical protein
MLVESAPINPENISPISMCCFKGPLSKFLSLDRTVSGQFQKSRTARSNLTVNPIFVSALDIVWFETVKCFYCHLAASGPPRRGVLTEPAVSSGIKIE